MVAIRTTGKKDVDYMPLFLRLMADVKNGYVSIIKQDGIVIQINRYEQASCQPEVSNVERD